MRGWLGLLAGISCLSFGSGVATARPSDGAAPASQAVACGPAGARTLAADRSARVYAQGQRVYGCSRDGTRSYDLGATPRSTREGRVGPIDLAGVDVAYGLAFQGVDTVSAEVRVRRLTDGVLLRRESSVQGAVGPEYFETVEKVVVKRDGSVAWIGHVTWVASSGNSVTEVEKSDRTRRTLLDRGDRIRLHSLRLHRSELTWRDGTTRRARLS